MLPGHSHFNSFEVTGTQPWPHPSRLRSATSASASLDPKESSFAMRYWTCMYWALTILTKVPWIAPQSVPEMIFASFAVASGTLFYAFLIGETSAITLSVMKVCAAIPLMTFLLCVAIPLMS